MDTMQPQPVHSGHPYFMGDHALIKFTSGEEGHGPETYWLADKSNHTLRPFESEAALQKAFGDGYQDAMDHVVSLVPPTISSDGEITDGVLHDFNILSPDYAIREDGTAKKLHFSPHQLKGRYGKAIDQNAEGLATEAVDGFLGILKNKAHLTKIPPSFINELRRDHQLMAFYISAMAYGGYSLHDIYADISRRFKSGKQ